MKTILVVDDDFALLNLFEAILKAEGYIVCTAQSGMTALALLGVIKAPDLILLDMRMDGMSGPEFLAILVDEWPEIIANVPVVFLSAADEVPSSYESGFIRKPMDIDQFIIDVRGFVERGVKSVVPVTAKMGDNECALVRG